MNPKPPEKPDKFAAIREEFRTLCQNLSTDEALEMPLEEVEKYIEREGLALLNELYQAALSDLEKENANERPHD